jgi:hypothetical protein
MQIWKIISYSKKFNPKLTKNIAFIAYSINYLITKHRFFGKILAMSPLK